MIHRQLGKRRSVKGAMSFARGPLFVFLITGPPGLASAGEFDRSTLRAAVAGPARCDGGGEGLGVLKDSGDCKRIRGYIAAGAQSGKAEPIGGRPSPFGKLEAPEFVGSVRSTGATIIDAPGAQDRFFLPPGSADVAR